MEKKREKTGFVWRNVPQSRERVKTSVSLLILLLSVFSSDMLTSQSNTNPPQRITPPLLREGGTEGREKNMEIEKRGRRG